MAGAIFNTVPPLAAGAGMQFDGERFATAAAPRNWLDNSDFTNLVAQAGIGGNHGSVAYAADRWKLTSGTVTYTVGTGLKLNGTITQVLENAPTDGSCFVGMVSGTATIALSGNTVTITSSGGVIKWAALYAEKFSAENRPEYQAKGRGAEYSECLRYFERLGEVQSESIGAPTFSPQGATSFVIGIRYTRKRKKPSVVTGAASNYRALLTTVHGGAIVGANGLSSISAANIEYDNATLLCTTIAAGGDYYQILQRQDNANAAYIDIVADL